MQGKSSNKRVLEGDNETVSAKQPKHVDNNNEQALVVYQPPTHVSI